MDAVLCQINTTPGDFKGNMAKMVEGMRVANKWCVDLVVFPELTIPGYLCRDMMFRKGFVEENLYCVQEIIKENNKLWLEGGKETTVVFGYIDKNHSGVGKPFRNMAAVVKNGILVGTYAKQLLPFYDVFDEGRYFEPGNQNLVIDICGEKWGICICEDVWNDKDIDDYSYRNNPLAQYRKIGVDNIISINSSPFVQGKPQKRIDMLTKSSSGGYFIYVNQVGGQDELVFDGNSFVCDSGTLVASQGQDTYMRWSNRERGADVHFTDGSIAFLCNMLVIGLHDYVKKSGFEQVVVGSSGGIDSAVVLALACEAFGPKNVHGIRMPTYISSKGSKDDALELHKNLGCNDYLVPIEHDHFINEVHPKVDMSRDPNKVAYENVQARLRGMTVMYFSNAYGIFPLTTGNKTELALGYATLFGDMAGGFAPISDLYKGQVYELARHLGKIPEQIINKAPSAELAEGQTDEASLMPYPYLDNIVKAYIEDYIADYVNFIQWCKDKFIGIERHQLVGTPGVPLDFKDRYEQMIRLINVNEFKRRQAAPGIKVSKVAFGMGRRLPICKG